MEPVWLAVIASFMTLATMMLTGIIEAKARSAQWDRADKLAERIEKRTDAAEAKLDDQLKQIHTAVNSGLTAVMQSRVDAVRRELAALRQVEALTESAGRTMTDEQLAEMRGITEKITQLEKDLTTKRSMEN